MWVVSSLRSSFLFLALGLCACGGAAPPPPAAPDAAPVTAEPATTAEESAPSTDDETWKGESAAKSEPGADAPNETPASGVNGTETRSMDVIRNLVMQNRKDARKCYQDARKDELKDIQGNVVIHFVLDPDGKVKTAELNQERSTLKAAPVVDCVIGVIKGIRFPKSSRAMETSVNYPFNFTP